MSIEDYLDLVDLSAWRKMEVGVKRRLFDNVSLVNSLVVAVVGRTFEGWREGEIRREWQIV